MGSISSHGKVVLFATNTDTILPLTMDLIAMQTGFAGHLAHLISTFLSTPSVTFTYTMFGLRERR